MRTERTTCVEHEDPDADRVGDQPERIDPLIAHQTTSEKEPDCPNKAARFLHHHDPHQSRGRITALIKGIDDHS